MPFLRLFVFERSVGYSSSTALLHFLGWIRTINLPISCLPFQSHTVPLCVPVSCVCSLSIYSLSMNAHAQVCACINVGGYAPEHLFAGTVLYTFQKNVHPHLGAADTTSLHPSPLPPPTTPKGVSLWAHVWSSARLLSETGSYSSIVCYLKSGQHLINKLDFYVWVREWSCLSMVPSVSYSKEESSCCCSERLLRSGSSGPFSCSRVPVTKGDGAIVYSLLGSGPALHKASGQGTMSFYFHVILRPTFTESLSPQKPTS